MASFRYVQRLNESYSHEKSFWFEGAEIAVFVTRKMGVREYPLHPSVSAASRSSDAEQEAARLNLLQARKYHHERHSTICLSQ